MAADRGEYRLRGYTTQGKTVHALKRVDGAPEATYATPCGIVRPAKEIIREADVVAVTCKRCLPEAA